MAKNRKCILCETVYVSRQEMEEHMRSMLHHRELENLKGRFGIEMVPIDQEDHSQEEEDFTLLEGFHWDSLLGAQTPPTSRKRSLSESSIAPTPNAPFLDNLVIKSEPQEPSQDTDLLQEIEMGLCDAEHTAQRRLDLLQRSHSVAEESSGTEMCEGQGTSKKRRARDVPHPETSSLEHHTKRRKKSKKERSHIMELLAVSLREDELSRSLLSLDTDLIKARAALEAAYVEVQRLMIAKQQVRKAKRVCTVQLFPLYYFFLNMLHYKFAQAYYTSYFTEAALYSLPSPERRSELCQRRPDQERDEFGDSVDSKESLADLVQSIEKGIQASQGHTEPNTNDKMPAPSWRDSEVGSFVESTAAPSFETPSGFNVPASPSEMRSVKKVRKLKKRKSLKKAQSSELPESSDTEMDTEASRPRCPRSRRRNSGGSQVSTSNQQTEEREEDVKMEEEEELHIEKKDPKPSKSSAKQLRVMLTAVTVKAEPEKNAPGFSGPTPDPDSAKPEAQNVACYEVSSTSDMDVSPAPERYIEWFIYVSSDHGEDDVPTEGSFEGHLEAVNSMQIHDGLLYTCSGDRTVRAFDIVSHKCVAVFEGHSSKVNALLVSAGPYLHRRLYTGSSDLTIRCYSLTFEEQFSLADRVLCLHSRWKIMFAGLGNGTVVNFNLKTNKQMDVFECHGPRAVSCLASSQEGARRLLLVGSYDNTISVRDAKNGLLLRTLEGHSKTVLCMKVVNDLVFSGSSDQCVYAHNIHSGQLVRTYKGHSHAVSVVCVQGKVMLTACLDKLIRVYDLQSHEQLQVYGGHKDMVMCMTTHKNMIYTGCYDGSVQAIKLNLMQNYHCRWHGCSMVFGVLDHLEHHLCNNHTSQNLQMLRCRWKNCEEFFSGRISSKKAMLLHMQKHAAEESQVEP
uniref:C2H2-type domain-containing protein n=1 Tax=Periophthalmus magnuspinnatus TaxID=409849 RepID=A0A3B4B8Z3_9GOBI